MLKLKAIVARICDDICATPQFVAFARSTLLVSAVAIASFSDARAGLMEHLEEARTHYGNGAWFSPGIEQIELKDFCEVDAVWRDSLENCKDKGYGGKVVFGYNLASFAALEGGYLYGWGWEKEFNGVDGNGNAGVIKRDLSTYWAGASVNFPLVNNWGVFGRYGYHWYDLMSRGESDASRITRVRRRRPDDRENLSLVGIEYDGRDPYWGAGIEYRGESSTFKVGYVDYSMKSKANDSGEIGRSALGTIKNPRGIELQWGWTFGGVSKRSTGEFLNGVLLGMMVLGTAAEVASKYQQSKYESEEAQREAQREAERQQAERQQEEREAERQQEERQQETERQQAEQQQQAGQQRQEVEEARNRLNYIERQHQVARSNLAGKHKSERGLLLPSLTSAEEVKNVRKRQDEEWTALIERQRRELDDFVRQHGREQEREALQERLSSATRTYKQTFDSDFGKLAGDVEQAQRAREESVRRLEEEAKKAKLLAENRKDPNQCASLRVINVHRRLGTVPYQDLQSTNVCGKAVQVVYRTKSGVYNKIFVKGRDTANKRVHLESWFWDGSKKCVEYYLLSEDTFAGRILSAAKCAVR